MKKKLVIMGSVAIIGITSMGNMAFAQQTNKIVENETINNHRIVNKVDSEYGNRWGHSNCLENGHRHENEIKVMRENGFEDMATYMEEGNYEAMEKWMNDMSDVDRDKMINIMSENGHMSGMGHMMNNNHNSTNQTNQTNRNYTGCGSNRGHMGGMRNMMGRHHR